MAAPGDYSQTVRQMFVWNKERALFLSCCATKTCLLRFISRHFSSCLLCFCSCLTDQTSPSRNTCRRAGFFLRDGQKSRPKSVVKILIKKIFSFHFCGTLFASSHFMDAIFHFYDDVGIHFESHFFN